jgi:hypothetical protein
MRGGGHLIEDSCNGGQMRYEVWLLFKKTFKRNRGWFQLLSRLTCFEPNPLFRIVPGSVEPWEKIPEKIRGRDLTKIRVGSREVRIRLCRQMNGG